MVPRGGVPVFRKFNDLARGGTIARPVAFRNIPGPSVPQKEAGAEVVTLAPTFVRSSNPTRQAKDQLDAAL